MWRYMSGFCARNLVHPLQSWQAWFLCEASDFCWDSVSYNTPYTDQFLIIECLYSLSYTDLCRDGIPLISVFFFKKNKHFFFWDPDPETLDVFKSWIRLRPQRIVICNTGCCYLKGKCNKRIIRLLSKWVDFYIFPIRLQNAMILKLSSSLVRQIWLLSSPAAVKGQR